MMAKATFSRQQAAAQSLSRLRHEWAETSFGTLCCWELTGAEMATIAERSQRPQGAGGGVSETTTLAWMALFSCRTSDEMDAQRIWNDMELGEMMQLPLSDYGEIMRTVRHVNGLDPTDIERVRDFTPATGAPQPSDCKSSASSNSTGSPPNSISPITS